MTNDQSSRAVVLADVAAALDTRLRGGFVQDVRVAGPDLLALSVRQPGHSVSLALSALADAPGVMLLDDFPPQQDADGMLLALRDLLRSCLVGGRIEQVAAAARDGHDVLILEAMRQGGAVAVVLDASGRGNLEVHREGHAPQALRPPAGEPPAAATGVATMDETTAARVLGDVTARVAAMRSRVLHARRLTDVRQRLRRSVKAAARLVERREQDVSWLGDPARLRREADALAAYLHVVRRGQRSLEVDDWQGSPLAITLDPGLRPPESLRRAYARAAKAERGVLEAGTRLDEARERLSALGALDARAAAPQLDDVEARDELARLERDASRLVHLERVPPPPRRAKGHAETPARGPREYRSLDGHRILVGRSSLGNDELTFRVARGNDVWLHARGAAGAHVVLKLPKGAEVPSESLLDAATLAHLHSRMRDEPRGEITWCRAKDVSKRRGMKPGQVLVAHERVISLRVEPERVARLEAGDAVRGPS